MKVYIIFLGFLAIALARNTFVPNQFIDEDDIHGMIQGKGYPVEQYKVNTSDGYILDLYRIPRGRISPQQHQEEEVSQEQEYSRKNHQRQFMRAYQQLEGDELDVMQSDETQRPAVLLMHGFMSSPEDFVINDMALQLVDNGYDVYLGSARGSRYGLQHRYLNPNKDPSFWNYCFDDIGARDLPAIIDKVLQISGRETLSYIGHMEGTTMFYVMGSERPQYLKKIDKMISLGPIAYMKHSTNGIMKTIAENMKRGWLMANVGVNKVQLSDNLLKVAKDDCDNSFSQICDNVYFLVNGYNSEKMNKTILKQVINRVPFGGAARELIHFAQMISTGRFQRFDPTLENSVTQQHDLSRIDVPVAVFYAKNDAISSVVDVERLIEELPNVFYTQPMSTYTNNLDLVYGKQLNLLSTKILDCLKQQVSMKNSL